MHLFHFRCFDNCRDVLKSRIVDEALKGRNTEISLADVIMAIYAAVIRRFGVVEVERNQSI